MNFSLDDDDTLTGGLVRGGEFGESQLARPMDSVPLYFSKTSPNLVVGGAIGLAGLGLLAWLISSLGAANPNNQLMASQEITSKAYSDALKSTSEAVKSAVNQRPACTALVCVMPAAEPAAAPTPTPTPTQEPAPAQQPYYQEPYAPPYYQQPTPQPTPDVVPVPAVPTTAVTPAVDFQPESPAWWHQQYQNDPNYVRSSIAFCNQNGWGRADCAALSTLLQ